MDNLNGMTRAKWDSLRPEQRAAMRDLGDLSPQLTGLEGWRVEVIRQTGEIARFIVGRSTGWRPCHLEISRRNALGGGPADKLYLDVRKLYKARP